MVKKGKIICSINMFDLKQHILFFDYEANTVTELGMCNTRDIGYEIAKYSLMKEIDEIELLGDAKYLQMTAQIIQETRMNNYNMSKVRIYINGKLCN